MSLVFKTAVRNIFRNGRRSFMTGSAVAAGAAAMMLFGGFVAYIFAGLETSNVQRIGHLSIFRTGYFLFGSGNPAAYGIDDYRRVIDLVSKDAVIAPLANVVTPTQSLVGIAGNFSSGSQASKTFFGVGLVPSARDRMRMWDEHETGQVRRPDGRLADDDENRGLVGVGLARILGLCGPLHVANCPAAPVESASKTESAKPREDLADLAQLESGPGAPSKSAAPHLELLGATASGAPNVVSLSVAGAEPQGVRELDDNFIAMHLALAQQLVYGRGEHKVTAIVLQLHRTEDMPLVRARLQHLIAQNHLDLEVRDFGELAPFYVQVVAMFGTIFVFISLVMGVIVLFAVVNTMTMNVMERTNEIGTIRAMGVRRGGVRRQFILEGALIGAIGATVGAVLALIVAAIVNHAGLTWVPPANSAPTPFSIDVANHVGLVVGTWLALTLVAMAAALLPANRAARLSVVDALRHV
ncbi:MAG TPA: FtsX-like permease family protein [Usitatibacter sp.]|jgi:putative ABC transport system permease protein|nr:FtsX-like permease family protein [Usitatibacter sp.]